MVFDNPHHPPHFTYPDHCGSGIYARLLVVHTHLQRP